MQKIENIKEFVDAKLAAGTKTFYATKVAVVQARTGKIGEKIRTQMKDGHIETENTIKTDDEMIIRNPSGEEYIISGERFRERYITKPLDKLGKWAMYQSLVIPQELMWLDNDVEFVAPWGTPMSVKGGGVLNITNRATGDIYGIEKNALLETYRFCDKDGNIINGGLLNEVQKRSRISGRV